MQFRANNCNTLSNSNSQWCLLKKKLDSTIVNIVQVLVLNVKITHILVEFLNSINCFFSGRTEYQTSSVSRARRSVRFERRASQRYSRRPTFEKREREEAMKRETERRKRREEEKKER